MAFVLSIEVVKSASKRTKRTRNFASPLRMASMITTFTVGDRTFIYCYVFTPSLQSRARSDSRCAIELILARKIAMPITKESDRSANRFD